MVWSCLSCPHQGDHDRHGGVGAVCSGMRHADAAAAMISAVVRSSGTPVTGWCARKPRTARSADRPQRGPVAEQFTVEGGHHEHVGRQRAGRQGHRVGERDDFQQANADVLRRGRREARAHGVHRVDQRLGTRRPERRQPADEPDQRVQFVPGHQPGPVGSAETGLAGRDDGAEQDHRADRRIRVAREHGVHAEGALAFGHQIDGLAGLRVQPPHLGRKPVAEHRQAKAGRGRPIGEWLAPGAHAPVGELLDKGGRQHLDQRMVLLAAPGAETGDLEHGMVPQARGLALRAVEPAQVVEDGQGRERGVLRCERPGGGGERDEQARLGHGGTAGHTDQAWVR